MGARSHQEEAPIGDELWIVEYDFKYYEKLFSMAEADAPAGNGDRSHTESHLLAEEIGGSDEEDHQDGEDEEGDLQPFVDLATEGDGIETLTLEAGSVVVMMMMMAMRGVIFH